MQFIRGVTRSRAMRYREFKNVTISRRDEKLSYDLHYASTVDLHFIEIK